jgi:NADPH-dependent curcumin reductase CurA
MRARMEGFIVIDYMHQSAEAIQDLLAWIGNGELKFQVDVQEGFENIPKTLQRLFTGQNLGKQLLKLGDPT